jgi:adenylate kinase family enzyme
VAHPSPQAAILKRLEAYKATSDPLLALYERRGVLQRFSGNESDAIYALVKPALTALLSAK